MKAALGFRSLLRPLAGTGAVTAAARLASFLLFAVMARALPTEAFAGMIFVIGTSQMVAQFGSLGWTSLIYRMVPRFDDTNTSIAKGFFVRSLQIPLAATLLLGAMLFLISRIPGIEFGLSESLAYTALILPLVLSNGLLRSYLVGWRRPGAGVGLSEAMPFALTLVFGVIFGVDDLAGAVACLAAGYGVGTAAQLLILRRPFVRMMASATAAFATREWTRVAALAVVGFAGKLLMDRTDALLLAPMRGMEELAYYGAVTRLSNLLLFLPIVLTPVLAPRISAAFARGDISRIRFAALLQIGIIGLASLPPAIVLVLFPAPVLSLAFGPTYTAGAGIMWIVASAQVVFALSLPLSSLLLMTDGERPYALASLNGFVVNFALAVILIPPYGIAGAALSTLAGVFAFCGTTLFASYRWFRVPQPGLPAKSRD